jgi:hypothetical protein
VNTTTDETDMTPQPVYPLPGPGADDNDPRFTYGLIFDIADALTRHGYPHPHGAACADLMRTLFHYLHRENT